MSARLAAALAAVALASPVARAQTTTANWVSGVSGSWDDPTLWTTNPYYPNNGNPTGSAYAAVVDASAAAAYTVTLSRDVTVNSLLVNNANATVKVAAGGVLTGATVQAQDGTFQVAGGTLRNVTLVGSPTSLTPGRVQVTGTAALDNVTLQFLEVLSGQQVTVTNGLTLNQPGGGGGGGLWFQNFGGDVVFSGNQTLGGTGEIVFNQGSNYAGRVRAAPGGTLTIGSGVTIRTGAGPFNTIGSPDAGLVINGAVNSYNALKSITITGLNWVNNGQLTQSNAGGIDLEGTFTTAGLGNFSSPQGRIVVNGRLDNTGATLQMNAAHGYLSVQGGTIVGGTVQTRDGVALVTNGGTAPRMATLDGITLDGQLNVVIGRTEVHNGLTLANNAQVVVNGSISNTITVLAFVGDSTLGGTGTVRIESPYVTGDTIRAEGGTLTVGPGVTIRNVPGASGVVGGASGGLLNQGTVSSEASGRTVQVLGGAVANDGTMRATNGGTLFVNAAGGFTNRGLLLADTGSTVTVTNTLTQTGTAAETRVIGSLGGGVAALQVALQGGRLTGTGTVTGSVTNTGGTVAPGLSGSTGVLTVGNYTQGSGGAAEFRLGGTTRGTLYDALNAGAVQLDGTVRVRLVTGYAPAAGDAFDLLDRTGTFAGTPSFDFSAAALGPGLTWDTTAFPTTGVVQVVPVPEPGAALAPAVLAAWLARRRRKEVR